DMELVPGDARRGQEDGGVGAQDGRRGDDFEEVVRLLDGEVVHGVAEAVEALGAHRRLGGDLDAVGEGLLPLVLAWAQVGEAVVEVDAARVAVGGAVPDVVADGVHSSASCSTPI